MARKTLELSLFDPAIVRRAAADSFLKLAPRTLARNPVMFVVGVGAALTTLIFLRDLASGGDAGFSGQIAGWHEAREHDIALRVKLSKRLQGPTVFTRPDIADDEKGCRSLLSDLRVGAQEGPQSFFFSELTREPDHAPCLSGPLVTYQI